MSAPSLDRRQFLIGAAASAAVVVGPHVATAQPTGASRGDAPLIPRRRLFADPERGWARISPDGTRVAFISPVDGIQNLWVGPLADVRKARPVTRVTDR